MVLTDALLYSEPKDLLNKNITYKYDSLNRLSEENNSVLGRFIYNYQNEKLISVNNVRDTIKITKKDKVNFTN